MQWLPTFGGAPADGLLRIAAGGEALPRQIVLAGAPLAFADILRETAWRLHGRRPLLVPLPSAPLLRVLGLVGLTVQSDAEDAARLGLSLRPLATGLSADAGRRRRGRAGEAAAYLRYVLGQPGDAAPLSARLAALRFRRHHRSRVAAKMSAAAAARHHRPLVVAMSGAIAVIGSGPADRLGEINGAPGLHAVDGAALPSLPARNPTLTIMANADRIGAALAAAWRR